MVLVKQPGRSWDEATAVNLHLLRDGAGTFLEVPLREGRWDLAVLFSGNEPGFVSEVAVSAAVAPLINTCHLAAARELHALFRDRETGKPLSSWRAFLRNADSGQTVPLFSQRPIGEGPAPLDFRSLPRSPGWILEVNPGAGHLRQKIRLSDGDISSPIDLGSIDFEMGGSLGVTIRSAHPPLGPITLSVGDPQDQSVVFGTTNLDSAPEMRAALAPLPAGRLVLTVSSQASGLVRRFPVLVRPPDATKIELALEPVLISGRVARGPVAVESASIEVLGPVPRLRRRATTGPDGQYEIAVWSAGDYILKVSPPSGRWREVRKISVADGDPDISYDVDLPGGHLNGLVSDAAADTPISGATVEVASQNSKILASVATASGPEGSFELDGLPPGPSTVTITASGYATIKLKDVMVEENSPELDVSMRKAATLRGRVTSALGDPLPNVLVARDCCTGSGEPEGEVETSEDGTFEFGDVVAGQHTLAAISCGGALALTASAGVDDAVELVVPPQTQSMTIQPLVRQTALLRIADVIIGVDSMAFPLTLLQGWNARCGGGSLSNEGLVLSLLPYGQLRAINSSGKVLSTWTHDGPAERWTFYLPN